MDTYFKPNQEADETVVIEDAIQEMKEKKSTFMYHFVESNKECLESLRDDPLAEPLYACKIMAQQMRIGNHD